MRKEPAAPDDAGATVVSARARAAAASDLCRRALAERGAVVPIEKLFMTDIGFDNGSVALMAAAYDGGAAAGGAVGHPG